MGISQQPGRKSRACNRPFGLAQRTAGIPVLRVVPRFLLLITMLLMGSCARPALRPPRNVKPYRVTVLATGYCPCGKCCNWRRNLWGRPVVASGPDRGKPKRVGITSSGTRARRGTIAADLRVFPYGTVMYVPGYGYGRVEDTGSSLHGRHIDLFFPRHSQAVRWGRRRLEVMVWPVR